MLKLYSHPFSSYCQKVLIALYENAIPFEYCNLEDASAKTALAAISPLGRFPVLVDGERTVLESTSIIEYLQVHAPGAVRLIPDGDAGLETRMLDRIFDGCVMTPLQQIVGDHLRPAASRDAYGLAEARGVLDRMYPWLDQRLAGGAWCIGDEFTLADCAAGPALFYADWAHPIPARCERLRAYRARLLARPSFARAVDEARPYRGYFPLGAPDRD